MRKMETDLFTEEIEIPSVVQSRADAAFLKIREEGTERMKGTEKNRKKRRMAGRVIAAAACAALLLATGEAVNVFLGNAGARHQNPDSGRSGPAQAHGFSVTAYAAEGTLAQMVDGKLVLTDSGASDGSYTGMMFQVQGQEISNIDIIIDTGELYSATVDQVTQGEISDWLAQGGPDEDQNPDTHTIVHLEQRPLEEKVVPPDAMLTRYHCTRLGSQVTAPYEQEVYYGFYIPDSVWSAADEGEDLAAAGRRALALFDGGTLTITVTYTDGSSQTKEYGLSVKKLAQDADGTVTQEEWTGGAEGMFVYGILVKER